MFKMLVMLRRKGLHYVVEFYRGREEAKIYRKQHELRDRYHTAREAQHSYDAGGPDLHDGFDEGWLSVESPDDLAMALSRSEVTSGG